MSLFAANLAPKEFDEIKLEPASKPTTVIYKFKGETLRTLELTYETGTENIEAVKVK